MSSFLHKAYMICSNSYTIYCSCSFKNFNQTYKSTLQINIMEKRLLGIILSLLGVFGLIYAGFSFMNGGTDTRNIKLIIFTGILGAVFFIAGISLVRNTNDKAT